MERRPDGATGPEEIPRVPAPSVRDGRAGSQEGQAEQEAQEGGGPQRVFLRSAFMDPQRPGDKREMHHGGGVDGSVRVALGAGAAQSAELLTHDSCGVTEADIQRLRDVGFDDRAIHDATQIIAFFNYINRVASALGVPDEPDWEDDGLGI